MPPGWAWADDLTKFVRPMILVALTLALVYLAVVQRSERAVEALLVQFISVSSFYFGERSALKVPPPGTGNGTAPSA